MRRPRIKTIILAAFGAFALLYAAAAITLAFKADAIAVFDDDIKPYDTVAIFGASGTAGDGILKAALADPAIKKIHVITRRETPRIKAGVASGKVAVTIHTDYLDYQAIHPQLARVDAVYWAIGISSLGVDEETYGRIHVDFPAQFLREWTSVSSRPDISFHYISSSDISEDSSAMWAREKVRAERTLVALAEDKDLRVILYRPDYIGPTEQEAHIGQDLLYWFFAPVGAAVKAEQIGLAMCEVTARGDQFSNGDKLTTRSIIRFADAYVRRRLATTAN